jgi:hypothetical protein
VIALIGSAQEPDGYLYTARTICPRKTAQLGRRKTLAEC